MICLFLAMLELVRRQALMLTQQDAFGDIGLKKQRAFDEVLGQSLVAIEEEYSLEERNGTHRSAIGSRRPICSRASPTSNIDLPDDATASRGGSGDLCDR